MPESGEPGIGLWQVLGSTVDEPFELTNWQRAMMETVMASRGRPWSASFTVAPRRSGRSQAQRVAATAAAMQGEHVHLAARGGEWCVTWQPAGLILYVPVQPAWAVHRLPVEAFLRMRAETGAMIETMRRHLEAHARSMQVDVQPGRAVVRDRGGTEVAWVADEAWDLVRALGGRYREPGPDFAAGEEELRERAIDQAGQRANDQIRHAGKIAQAATDNPEIEDADWEDEAATWSP